jgi:hypothetical protein
LSRIASAWASFAPRLSRFTSWAASSSIRSKAGLE